MIMIVAQYIHSLVAHYSQDIHSISSDHVPYFDSLLGNCADDQLNNFLKHWLDKFVQHCQDETKNESISIIDSSHASENISRDKYIHVAGDLIYSYHDYVRSHCFQMKRNLRSESVSRVYIEKNACVILIHYETFLDVFTQLISNESLKGVESKKSNTESTCIENSIQSIHIAIKSLVHDIIHLTAIEKLKHKNKGDINDVRNWILPTLIRILQHAIHFMYNIVQISSNHITINDSNQSCTNTTKKYIRSLQCCLSYSLIVTSMFTSNYMDEDATDLEQIKNIISNDLSIFEILPNCWKDKFSLRHLLETCAYSPYKMKMTTHGSNADNDINNDHFSKVVRELGYIVGDKEDYTKISIETLDEYILDFDESSSSKLRLSWLDHTKGIGFRTGRALLQELDLIASKLKYLVNDEHPYCNIKTKMTAYERILEVVDINEITELIRANFFGRLDQSLQLPYNDDSENDAFFKKLNGNTDKLAFNGIFNSYKDKHEDITTYNEMRQIKTKPINGILTKRSLHNNSYRKGSIEQTNGIDFDEDKPFINVKARAASSIRLLSSIKLPGSIPTLLPIIYSLIDCNDCSLQSLGGSLFLHLLNQPTATLFFALDAYSDVPSRKNIHATNFEAALQIISSAIKTNDDTVSLAVLTAARCRLFSIAHTSKISQVGTYCRVAISDSMDRVRKRCYCGPSGEPKLLSSLLVRLIDIHFLLVQVAMLGNADAIEIGRLGLSTFLPLIRWDSTSMVGQRIQFVAILCLNSLLMGAYPIMERHGGKIMSELVCCIGRGMRDINISLKIQDKIYQRAESRRPQIEIVAEKLMLRALTCVAIYIASVALIICGDKANDVLKHIEEGHFMTELVDSCKLIRLESSNILEHEKNI